MRFKVICQRHIRMLDEASSRMRTGYPRDVTVRLRHYYHTSYRTRFGLFVDAIKGPCSHSLHIYYRTLPTILAVPAVVRIQSKSLLIK